MSSRKFEKPKQKYFKKDIKVVKYQFPNFCVQVSPMSSNYIQQNLDSPSRSSSNILRYESLTPRKPKNKSISPLISENSKLSRNKIYYPSIYSLSPQSRELISPFALSNKKRKAHDSVLANPALSIFPSLKIHSFTRKRRPNLNHSNVNN